MIKVKKEYSKKQRILKVIAFFSIEILYTIMMLSFFEWINSSFGSVTEFDKPLFETLKIILIMLIWIIGPMFNRYVVLVYSALYTAYFVSQTVYLETFGQYYRLSTALTLQNELAGVKDSALEMMNKEHWMPFIILIIMTIVFILLYFLLQRKSVKFYLTPLYKVLFIFLYIPIMDNYNLHNDLILETKTQEDVFQLNKTDYYIYDVMPNVNKFVETFGLYSLFIRDYHSLAYTPTLSQEDFDYVNSYLSKLEAPIENEYTGVFEGKNLVIIQAESYIDAIIHPELTPNIYKMKTQGINVRNFHTPLMPGSTSDTEFMAMTSLIPRGDGYAVSYKYPFNTYPVTLANIFKQGGYNADIYHNNYGNYYNRDDLFNTFGYDEFYDSTRFGFEDRVSDGLVGEKLQWIFPYWEGYKFGYWITYSGHQPYIFDEVGVDMDDVAKIQSIFPNLDDTYVSYYAKTMDLDKALGDIMSTLEYSGKLDDFVFVFLGDHIVKGLDFSKESLFYTQTEIEYNNDDFTTSLYIYNNQIEPLEMNKVSTVLDLIPTLANMFNLEYDYQKVLGHDILDPNYDGLAFDDYGNIETNNFKYNYNNDNLELFNDYKEEDARRDIENYLEKDKISRMILQLDYFKEVE